MTCEERRLREMLQTLERIEKKVDGLIDEFNRLPCRKVKN